MNTLSDDHSSTEELESGEDVKAKNSNKSQEADKPAPSRNAIKTKRYREKQRRLNEERDRKLLKTEEECRRVRKENEILRQRVLELENLARGLVSKANLRSLDLSHACSILGPKTVHEAAAYERMNALQSLNSLSAIDRAGLLRGTLRGSPNEVGPLECFALSVGNNSAVHQDLLPMQSYSMQHAMQLVSAHEREKALSSYFPSTGDEVMSHLSQSIMARQLLGQSTVSSPHNAGATDHLSTANLLSLGAQLDHPNLKGQADRLHAKLGAGAFRASGDSSRGFKG